MIHANYSVFVILAKAAALCDRRSGKHKKRDDRPCRLYEISHPNPLTRKPVNSMFYSTTIATLK